MMHSGSHYALTTSLPGSHCVYHVASITTANQYPRRFCARPGNNGINSGYWQPSHQQHQPASTGIPEVGDLIPEVQSLRIETDSCLSIITNGATSFAGSLNNEDINYSHLQRPISCLQSDQLQEQLAHFPASPATLDQSSVTNHQDSLTARNHEQYMYMSRRRLEHPDIQRQNTEMDIAFRRQHVNVTKPPEKRNTNEYEKVRKLLIKENGVRPELIKAMIDIYGFQCLASRAIFFGFADNENQESLSSSSDTNEFATARASISSGQENPQGRYMTPSRLVQDDETRPLYTYPQAADRRVPFANFSQSCVGNGMMHNGVINEGRGDVGGGMMTGRAVPNVMTTVSPQSWLPWQFDPMVCKICHENCINVTQLPCGHLICSACVRYGGTGYYNCQICGSYVEDINAYDRSQLHKRAY